MLTKRAVTMLSALLVAGMLALTVTPADAKNNNKNYTKAEKKEFKHWLRAQNHDWRRWMYQQKYEWWKWVHQQKHDFYEGTWEPSNYTFPGSDSGNPDTSNTGDTSDTGNTGGDPPVVEEPKPRFEKLAEFKNLAVRDNESGLIWDLAPFTSTLDWNSAWFGCASKILAGRMGWRLPSSAELATLIDTVNTDANGLHMPADHPFTSVQSDTFYWTATENRWPRLGAHVVHFVNAPYIDVKDNTGTIRLHWWCVRGTLQGPVVSK